MANTITVTIFSHEFLKGNKEKKITINVDDILRIEDSKDHEDGKSKIIRKGFLADPYYAMETQAQLNRMINKFNKPAKNKAKKK